MSEFSVFQQRERENIEAQHKLNKSFESYVVRAIQDVLGQLPKSIWGENLYAVGATEYPTSASSEGFSRTPSADFKIYSKTITQEKRGFFISTTVTVEKSTLVADLSISENLDEEYRVYLKDKNRLSPGYYERIEKADSNLSGLKRYLLKKIARAYPDCVA